MTMKSEVKSLSDDDLVALYDELGLELEELEYGSYSYDCVDLEFMEVCYEMKSRSINF